VLLAAFLLFLANMVLISLHPDRSGGLSVSNYERVLASAFFYAALPSAALPTIGRRLVGMLA
jgi:hypothetical protein